jgi:hypothetical protein
MPEVVGMFETTAIALLDHHFSTDMILTFSDRTNRTQ